MRIVTRLKKQAKKKYFVLTAVMTSMTKIGVVRGGAYSLSSGIKAFNVNIQLILC